MKVEPLFCKSVATLYVEIGKYGHMHKPEDVEYY